jgi:predicted O-methyltransferase YrrM
MEEMKDVAYYRHMCYPKPDQAQYIHGEDVAYLFNVLTEEKPQVVVEIGASYGTSSKLFAHMVKEYGGKLYSIEPDVKPEWSINMKEYGLLEYAEIIPKASPWVNWEGKPEIDFLFIDGWHSFRDVFVDYFYWVKYVKTGGIIAFHDCRAFTAVQKAIDEILRTEHLEFIGESTSKVGLKLYKKINDKRGRTAFFGPWVGELGFEVGWWQGYCRKESKNWDYVICSTYPGNEGLYEDFADEVEGHGLTGQPMCGWANGLTGDFEYPNVTKVFAPPAKKLILHEDQEYIIFGADTSSNKYDILLHVNEASRKQYPYWDELLKAFEGMKIGCFGKTGKWPDGHLEGTDDLRDIPIIELAQYMNGAKVVAGPCSGAMHFACYCKANVVVWAVNSTFTWGQTIRQRFESILNPLGADTIVIDEFKWEPPASQVIQAINNFI